MNPIVKQFKYGQHTVTLETGAIARQATAAVMASMDDTTVFVTVVAKKDVKEGQDFFPLTVNYQERTYAAGKIPGGFFKREGRPSEGETLIARFNRPSNSSIIPRRFLQRNPSCGNCSFCKPTNQPRLSGNDWCFCSIIYF